jgi:hypothetical protein
VKLKINLLLALSTALLCNTASASSLKVIEEESVSLLNDVELIKNAKRYIYKGGVAVEVAEIAAGEVFFRDNILESVLKRTPSEIVKTEGGIYYKNDDYMFWTSKKHIVVVEPEGQDYKELVSMLMQSYSSTFGDKEDNLSSIEISDTETKTSIMIDGVSKIIKLDPLNRNVYNKYIEGRSSGEFMALDSLDLNILIQILFGQKLPEIIPGTTIKFIEDGFVIKSSKGNLYDFNGVNLEPLFLIHKSIINHNSGYYDLDTGDFYVIEDGKKIEINNIAEDIFGSKTIKLLFKDGNAILSYGNIADTVLEKSNIDKFLEKLLNSKDVEKRDFDKSVVSKYPALTRIAWSMLPFDTFQLIVDEEKSIYFGVNKRAIKNTGYEINGLISAVDGYYNKLMSSGADIAINISNGKIYNKKSNGAELVGSIFKKDDFHKLLNIFTKPGFDIKRSKKAVNNLKSAASKNGNELYESQFFKSRPWKSVL